MNRYKKVNPDCPLCKGHGIYTIKNIGCGDDYNNYYSKIRCKCTLIERKAYHKLKIIDNNQKYSKGYL